MTPQAEDSARLERLLGDLCADRAPRPETQSAVIDVVLDRPRCARVSMGKLMRNAADSVLLKNPSLPPRLLLAGPVPPMPDPRCR